ncbi:MAG: 16S rRNA (guanine(966)-N(2))-methyltransferase RsmD [Clostridia bacterium]|nr:16S rRNA (guanine(966)-N(2))-methyltransferase RsmD [Clostridia bacterium]
MIRIVAGSLRGKRLTSPEGQATRPTLDRVRESLFNILQTEVPGATVLDLFSGCGAIALEAYSRGAKKVYACDHSSAAISVIRRNVSDCKADIEVLQSDYMLALKSFHSRGVRFDIIYLDPPYQEGLMKKALSEIVRLKLLNQGGVCVGEVDASGEAPECPSGLILTDNRKYGKARLLFWREEE